MKFDKHTSSFDIKIHLKKMKNPRFVKRYYYSINSIFEYNEFMTYLGNTKIFP